MHVAPFGEDSGANTRAIIERKALDICNATFQNCSFQGSNEQDLNVPLEVLAILGK